KGAGLPPRQVEWVLGLHKKVVAVILRENDDKKAREAIREVTAAELKALNAEDRKTLATALKGLGLIPKDKDEAELDKALPGAIEQSAAALQTPWFRYFLKYDPRPTLAQVSCPVLALNGEKDCQVPAKENLTAIAAALKKAGNKDA